jgi:hypothetical protein
MNGDEAKAIRIDGFLFICEEHYKQVQKNPIGSRLGFMKRVYEARLVRCGVPACENMAEYNAPISLILSQWQVAFSLALLWVES